jgi:hypothetical protein
MFSQEFQGEFARENVVENLNTIFFKKEVADFLRLI